jgi:hypothetical protein
MKGSLMFNEVFLFFYLVSVLTSLTASITYLIVGVIILMIAYIVLGAIYISDEVPRDEVPAAWDRYRSRIKTAVVTILLLSLATILIPNEKALYAGAGYYVAEQTEVTDSLMQLKDVVDARIEELMPVEEEGK